MTPYEVLGVAPDASEGEIRRAYVALARRFHPDVHAGGEERMRLVNEAWTVLGDRERRAAWDRAHAAGSAERPTVTGFRPHDPTGDDVDPRDLVDTPYRQSTPRQEWRRRYLTFAPVVLFAAAVGSTFWGGFFDNSWLLGTGVVLFSVACLAMIGVLLVAMVAARHDEG